jgi:hypothetical protein
VIKSHSPLALGAALTLLLTSSSSVRAAQDDTRNSLMGARETRPTDSGPATPFELFTERLRLDRRTQLPIAQQIFDASAAEAAPIAKEMLQIRQRLLNVALAKPEAIDGSVAEYAAAAKQMAAIEARAFGAVVAVLRPNQQNNAPQAWLLMAGCFGTQASTGGRGGGRGGIQYTRGEMIENAFKFVKDQRRTVKAILDEAQKSAAPVRDGLTKTRQSLGALIQTGRPQPEIEAAAGAYADQVAAITKIEMVALARLLEVLDRTNTRRCRAPS